MQRKPKATKSKLLAKAASKRRPARRHVTAAFHISDGVHHVVGVKALQVLLSNEGDGWFAQGLQIDYASCGATIEEAKKNFEEGLALTIAEHLKMYGEIDRLLRLAPQDAWNEYLRAPAEAIKAGYSVIEAFSNVKKRVGQKVGAVAREQVKFPFDVIHFLTKEAVAHPA